MLRWAALICGILTCVQVIQIVQDPEINIVLGLLLIVLSFFSDKE